MHSIFSFMAKVDPTQVAALKSYLATVQAAMPTHPDWQFDRLTKLHFASLLVVEDPNGRFDPCFVFENNIDGTIGAYIDQLCETSLPGIVAVYSACLDYRPGQLDAGAYARDYLRKHVLPPSASFVGNVARDVSRIRKEDKLVNEVAEPAADALVASQKPLSPLAAYYALRADVASAAPWALQPKGRLSTFEIFTRYARFGLLIGSALALLAVVPALIAVLLYLVVLRLHENTDEPEMTMLSATELAKLTAREDSLQQNHFASISLVKPGLFRQLTLRLILAFINRSAALSIDGTLSNLDNIHFAHWVLIDGGRRLMFLTNYDGSWENYLDDFIDKAATGLTAIWSNSVGFPRTKFLAFGGATDEKHFKNIARKTQVETAVFYSAYRTLTVPTIDNNSAIRDGLATPPEGVDVERLLQRL